MSGLKYHIILNDHIINQPSSLERKKKTILLQDNITICMCFFQLMSEMSSKCKRIWENWLIRNFRFVSFYLHQYRSSVTMLLRANTLHMSLMSFITVAFCYADNVVCNYARITKIVLFCTRANHYQLSKSRDFKSDNLVWMENRNSAVVQIVLHVNYRDQINFGKNHKIWFEHVVI